MKRVQFQTCLGRQTGRRQEGAYVMKSPRLCLTPRRLLTVAADCREMDPAAERRADEFFRAT
jgi:hypothetical protein